MNKFLPVLGRVLLAQIFLVQVVMLALNFMNTPDGYQGYQAWLGSHGLPGIMAPLIILVQMVGGLFLLLGFKTRVTAMVMAVYALLLILLIGAPDVPLLQYLAVIGGLLLLASQPSMACSLDNLKK